MNYQNEIDGLKAISVLSVILFHMNLPFFRRVFRCRYFFVISGFLIANIIFEELFFKTLN